MINLAITGHVDHGKSTFIGHLLWKTNSLPKDIMKELKKFSKDIEFAFLLDQFQEERDHAMTIDTTQIFFHTKKNSYVIIDTPGHLEFVKNMVTGVTKADASILIVSIEADLPIETKRHAYIVNLLGLKDMLVLVNKMDLADYSKEKFLKRDKEISSFLYELGIKPRAIIPLSAKYGDNMTVHSKNMDWYKGPTILEALEDFSVEKKRSFSPLRFPVQDVYQDNGEKILVGKIESGKINKGQTVIVFPSRREEKIKEIKIFGQKKRKGVAGESIGITLASGFIPDRGDILCQKESPPYIANSIRSEVLWMSERPLKIKDKLKIRCATQENDSYIEKIEKKINSVTMEEIKESQELRLNEVGQIILTTAKPMVADKFNFINELGRFVLEGSGQVEGGGIITEVIQCF